MKTDGAGLRVLVVEDEWLLAAVLVEALAGAGYSVLGPVYRVKDALALIGDGDPPDVGFLDISLGQADSFPIARDLVKRKIPFLFLTGYSKADLPEEFRNRPLASKPVALPILIESVASLVS